MSLLTDLMDRPLDPAYEAARRARQARGSETSGRRRPWNTALVGATAVLTGVLLATSALTYAGPESRDGRADLVARIEERRQAIETASVRNVALADEIHAREAGALGRNSDEAAQLEQLRVSAGVTPVTGPGVRITLDDAPGLDPIGGGPRDETDDTGRIVYRDLQNITNDLWAAGAEAIAINGHRLTSTTAIRFAGAAVLVGFRPLARPYVIEAVVGPEGRAAFQRGDGGRYLADLRTAYSARAALERAQSLSLPAADPLALEYAHRPGGARTPRGSAPTPPSPTSPSPAPQEKQ